MVAAKFDGDRPTRGLSLGTPNASKSDHTYHMLHMHAHCALTLHPFNILSPNLVAGHDSSALFLPLLPSMLQI